VGNLGKRVSRFVGACDLEGDMAGRLVHSRRVGSLPGLSRHACRNEVVALVACIASDACSACHRFTGSVTYPSGSIDVRSGCFNAGERNQGHCAFDETRSRIHWDISSCAYAGHRKRIIRRKPIERRYVGKNPPTATSARGWEYFAEAPTFNRCDDDGPVARRYLRMPVYFLQKIDRNTPAASKRFAHQLRSRI